MKGPGYSRKCAICDKKKLPKTDMILTCFPLDPKRCRLWVKATGLIDLVHLPIEKLHQLKYICDAHFASECFNANGNRLLKNAVPTRMLSRPPLPDVLFTEFPLHVKSYYDKKKSGNNSLEHDHVYGEGKKHIDHSYCLTSENERNENEIAKFTQQVVNEDIQAKVAKSTLLSVSDGRKSNGTESTPQNRNVIYTQAVMGKSTLLLKSDGGELNSTVESPRCYKCELCPYTSEIPDRLFHHRSLHCLCSCGHVAENPLNYEQHRATCGGVMSQVARLTCDKCDREDLDLESFAKHCATIQPCALCSLPVCEGSLRTHTHTDTQRVKHKKKRVRGRPRFTCVECGWSSVIKRDIMLHLIHHPQSSSFDVSVLTKCGILQEQLPTEC